MTIAALVIACAAFLLAAAAYVEAVAVRERLDGFVEDMNRELDDLS